MQLNPDAGCWFDTQSGNYSVLAALTTPPGPTHCPLRPPDNHPPPALLFLPFLGTAWAQRQHLSGRKWPTLSPAPLFSFWSACLLHRWLAATNVFTSTAYLWVPHLCHENESKQIKLQNLSQQLVLWDLRSLAFLGKTFFFFQSEWLLGMWTPGCLSAAALKSTIKKH